MTTQMPKPAGPYSPIVRAGDWLICSGQIGQVEGTLVDGGVPAQIAQAIRNLESVLASENAGLGDIVKTSVFLTDIGDFSAMNDAYVTAFGDHRPTRTTVAVAGLPMGAAVEVEAWAFIGGR